MAGSLKQWNDYLC